MSERPPWYERITQILSVKNREHSGDGMINDLLNIEGVDVSPQHTSNRTELDQISINTFRILLENDDPRWRLAYKLQRLKHEGLLNGEDFEHALRADYLSNHASIRRGFNRYIDEVTIPQLARALANIEIGNNLKPKLVNLLPLARHHHVTYGTGSIGFRHQPDNRGIMGCQEALWELRLFENILRPDDFIGRIGINFHHENKKKIVSIVNIQGAHGKPEIAESFAQSQGQGFGEFLIHSLKSRLDKSYELRGVVGRTENQALYKSVFKNTGIPGFKVKRLSGEQYVPSFEEIFKDSL